MAFCKYCGNQVEDGQVCNCEGAQAERAAATNPQPQVQSVAAPQSNIGPELANFFKKFFTAPVAMLEEAYTAATQTAQFIVLAISAVVMLIFTWLAFAEPLDDEAFKYAFFVLLSVVVVKAIHTAVAYVFKDTEGSFVQALALFSTSTIIDALGAILMFFSFKMTAGADSFAGAMSGIFGVIIAWTIAGAVYVFSAYNVVIKNKAKAVNAFVITAVVLSFIVCAIIGGQVDDMMSSFMYGLF